MEREKEYQGWMNHVLIENSDGLFQFVCFRVVDACQFFAEHIDTPSPTMLQLFAHSLFIVTRIA